MTQDEELQPQPLASEQQDGAIDERVSNTPRRSTRARVTSSGAKLTETNAAAKPTEAKAKPVKAGTVTAETNEDKTLPVVCEDGKIRCSWARENNMMRNYHDEEWGVPVHDDRILFSFLTLEGAQAGLSWNTILNKKEGYRDAFADWDIEIVASYNDSKVEELVLNPNIVRHRGKIQSTISNAKLVLDTQREFGSFDKYIWSFMDHKTIRPRFTRMSSMPASTPVSVAMSKSLKGRGFRFVGPTICYAFMQAVGMTHDHTQDCFRFRS